ncbi:MAG: saccharopine dehydrogenase NADP-binding domain-containing protein [Pseudonocardiales bacterium]|nr:saccharopine dehydrogenase NADP-binding domain-containing protein [Pseudonocardiales bacterium]
MIVLFGATGYTGRRVAEAMVRRGLRPILAGRNAERLAALTQRLKKPGLGKLDVVCADISDLAPVRALIGRGDVMVSTVGPFHRLGAPAVRAAVDAGAIYLDSTGEPPFIRRVFEEFGPLAQRSGASLITACGHDYVPGNLAGALALRRASARVHRLEVGYLISGGGRAQVISRGTGRSALGLLTEQSFTRRDGIRPEPTGSRTPTFTVGGLACSALAVGATEHYTLPRLAGPDGLPEVDVYLGRLGAATGLARLAYRLVPALLALPGARRLVRGIGEFALRWSAEEPDPVALAQVRSHVVATAYAASGAQLAQVRLMSGDPYQLTADLLAWGAQRAVDHGVSGPGALGPVQAFGLDVLVAGSAEIGLRVIAGME